MRIRKYYGSYKDLIVKACDDHQPITGLTRYEANTLYLSARRIMQKVKITRTGDLIDKKYTVEII